MPSYKKFLLGFFVVFLLGAFTLSGASGKRKIIDESQLALPYAPGEVMVKFNQGVTMDSIRQIANTKGMVVKKEFKLLSKLMKHEYVLLKSSTANTLDMVTDLKKNTSVEAVSPNNRNQVDATPNDTYYAGYLWGMNNTGQTGGTPGADIDAPEAWDINTGSADNIVAVIDTGLDRNHPDLAANVWRNEAEFAGTPGVDDDGNGYVDDIYGIDPAGVDGYTPDTDPMDGYGHGTHCSGTIGAVGNNSLGVVGVNWHVKIMGLKMFDDTGSNGYDAFAIEDIEYILFQKIYRAKNIVSVNASWGSYNYFDTALYDAITALGDAGIVFCAAAGNDANDNDGDDVHFPSSYDLPNIIAVAATDDDDLLSSFSNYGATSVDLAAPGSSIASTVPGKYVPQTGDIFFDNMESGAGNWVTGGTNNSWAITTNIEKYWGAPYPVAPSPPHFWSDSPVNDSGYPYGRYLNNTDSYLEYNADIDLSGHVSQKVYFGLSLGKHIGAGDHLYLEISADSGSNWTVLNDWSWTEGYIYYWASLTWTIPDAFKTAHFRMRFHLITDAASTGLGVVIDDIGIGTVITYDYEIWSGTSMATPHVTGAVALMAAQFPSESMTARISRILANVDPLSSLDGLCVTGGRLNLYNAISDVTADKTITVTSPNGGEEWTMGSLLNITWNSTGAITGVNIDYSTDSGAHWLPVAITITKPIGIPNTGSFTWTVPGPASTTCLVRVSDVLNATILDTSNAVFTILASGMETVSAPDKPQGPDTGESGSSYDFSTKGSESSMGVGHLPQYKFDWGDGTDSGWLNAGMINTQASHIWSAAGIYDVRAKARCSKHTSIESLWSDSHSITISYSTTSGKYNSPAQYKVLPEVIWASATGGGTWMSAVQITDISGGSKVSVYYNTAAGRRGPFLLWDNSSGGALSSVKYTNLLQTIDGLDTGAFTYSGTMGAVEFITQDATHVLQATARTLNGNYSKTLPAFSLHDSNTADTTRLMIIPNLTNNSAYRSTCGMFNPTGDEVTVKLKLWDATNTQIGTTISKTLSGYGFTSFSPFSEAGKAYPANSYDNVILSVEPSAGTGKVFCFGASANNVTNDPAAHIAVQSGSIYDNGPSSLQILPEAIWAPAAGGGTWISAVQVVDVTGGSAVSVTFDYGGGLRRGPFLLWTGSVAGSMVKYANILQTIDGLDSGAFTYSGRVGTVEFQTQDSAHSIGVTARTLNGNYSKTFPGLNLVDAETADTSRVMLIQNYTNNSTYRSTCGFFNPTADALTVEFKLLNASGAQIGASFSKTFVGYDFQAFSPFNEAGVPYPANSYDDVILTVNPTSGAGQVVCFGASANNASNDPASHLAVQGQ